MTRIYLVRHAQSEGNFYRRAHGMYNSMLTPQGRIQLEALKKRFADIPVDVVYTSPLYRTRATAAAIYEAGQIPVHVLQGTSTRSTAARGKTAPGATSAIMIRSSWTILPIIFTVGTSREQKRRRKCARVCSGRWIPLWSSAPEKLL